MNAVLILHGCGSVTGPGEVVCARKYYTPLKDALTLECGTSSFIQQEQA